MILFLRISLYLGTDDGLVKSSKPLPKAEVTLEGDMYFGGLEDQEVGFNGNIRQVYMCGRYGGKKLKS